MATIKPNEHFAPAEAAVVLEKAMKGAGTEEDAIIKILTSNTGNQRAEIATAYKAEFDKELSDEIRREIKGNFKDACLAMLTRIPMFLASQLHAAMKGMGTKEAVLAELLGTATHMEIQQIRACYEAAYGKELEKEVARETAGEFKKFMVALASGNREPGDNVHEGQAKEDAAALYKAGEKKLGTNEKVFTDILSLRNFAQLRQTFIEYDKLTGHGFEVAVKKETAGDLQKGYMTIVQFAKDNAGYFANRLHESLKGKNNDGELIRIIVSRSENDLEHIARQFEVMYGKRLAEFIEDDCKGDFGKLLARIVGDI